MDIEQDALIKQMDSRKLKGKELEDEKNKIKEAKQKYLEEIRDLRGKITISRRND
jgi:FtsZ-binding cell division protein ZapB